MRALFLAVVTGMTFLVTPVGEARAAPPGGLPATVRVYLPADATLTVDDQATTSTSATRSFVTPPLEPGKDYYYTFRAEFPRGSQTVTVTERVAVRAGRETVVSFGAPEGAAESPEGTAYRSFSITPASFEVAPVVTPALAAPAFQPRPAPAPAPEPVRIYNDDDYPRRGGPPGARRGVGQG
jgi:uncharacterized protein (TIGR03000 family)